MESNLIEHLPSPIIYLILLVLIRNLRDSSDLYGRKESIQFTPREKESTLTFDQYDRVSMRLRTPEVVVVKDDDEEDGWSKALLGEATFLFQELAGAARIDVFFGSSRRGNAHLRSSNMGCSDPYLFLSCD
ncbi:hypothetical protein HAX54_023125 [Datura stramonium]|uniref:Uncharacterized protein n=1 Tax=Datura stramonium TaxID=4076 RepID=A0ABS8RJV5_DATST|nr:hypothetical protein [Datura stramonium]